MFVVGLIVFAGADAAERCSARITRLRTELKKPAHYEFRFRKNSHNVSLAFFAAVARFAFTYYATTFEKPAAATAHLPLYFAACARICALAGNQLDRAHLTADMRESEKRARDRMAADVRWHFNREVGRAVLAKVRARDSASESLLQLADYVAGVRRWVEEGEARC